MVAELLIGIIIGICSVLIPVSFTLFEKNKLQKDVETINEDLKVTLDEVVDDNLSENEYKIGVNTPQEIEDQLVEYSKQKISNEYIVGQDRIILVKKVVLKPEETTITFEITNQP